jgi:hypothetical protein
MRHLLAGLLTAVALSAPSALTQWSAHASLPAAPVHAATPARASSGLPFSTLGELAVGDWQYQYLGNTKPYAYVVIQAYASSKIAGVKAANPATKVMTFFTASAVRQRTCTSATPTPYLTGASMGVDYCWLAKYHPSWMLHNRTGGLLRFADDTTLIATDIGSVGYRQQWATDVVGVARSLHFDGVYIDNINAYPGHGIDGQIPTYTDQAYGAASAGFLSVVGPALHAAGLTSIANVGVNPWVSWQVGVATQMAHYVDVFNKENFSRWGNYCGTPGALFSVPMSDGNPPLDMMENFERTLENAGTHISAIDYGAQQPTAADYATMLYGRASFLLSWDGKPGSAYFFRTCGLNAPAYPQWMTEVGTPLGPVTNVAGCYVRLFTNGLVVLNPSTTVSSLVPLGLGYHLWSGANVIGNLSLGPLSAQLLLL